MGWRVQVAGFGREWVVGRWAFWPSWKAGFQPAGIRLEGRDRSPQRSGGGRSACRKIPESLKHLACAAFRIGIAANKPDYFPTSRPFLAGPRSLPFSRQPESCPSRPKARLRIADQRPADVADLPKISAVQGHQQTRTVSISSRRPSFSIFPARWPTPTAQWCAGPWAFQSLTKRRAPMLNR